MLNFSRRIGIHPSLHFKKIGNYDSVRVGLSYRALGVSVPDGILRFWIDSHADYDALIKRNWMGTT